MESLFNATHFTVDHKITVANIKEKTLIVIEGSFEVKLPTIWTDEKQSREEAERRERLEEKE